MLEDVCVPYDDHASMATWPPKRWYLCTMPPTDMSAMSCELHYDTLADGSESPKWLCSHMVVANEPDFGEFFDEMMA